MANLAWPMAIAYMANVFAKYLIRSKFSADSIWRAARKRLKFSVDLFRKNQHFRPIAPNIFFVPKISPSKVGVIGVLIDKGVKRYQKHNICTCSKSPSIASKRNLKLMLAFC